jgi:hypothetical protein
MKLLSKNKLKYINLDGTILYYKCFNKPTAFTEFYIDETGKPPIFTIQEDCDCPKLSRGWWREKIFIELEKLNKN